MKTSLLFFARLFLAWLAVLGVISILWNALFGRNLPSLLLFAAYLVLFYLLISGLSHLRRIRLIAPQVNASTISNRQRRQIEIPLSAAETFEIVLTAIRELPLVETVDSVQDSLQIHAKVQRVHRYSTSLRAWEKLIAWLGMHRNQVFATVTPHDGTSSVALICEPEGGGWSDWFIVDNGTNLENAEAITRAISRRVTERRSTEQAANRETAVEKELAIAKLGLLHAQVEPHFLYNTLGSAKYLIKSDPERAELMLDNLILYLRHSLPRTEDTLSTLGEELERARAYLDILKIRMGNRLQTSIEVPAELLSTPFPSMMLQTLVENAIKHGLEPKSGGGTIWVLARLSESGVAVTVADDGRGFSTENAGTGIGLKNIRERLKLTYGSAASFNLVTNFPSGVAATITIPAPATSPLPPQPATHTGETPNE